MSGYVASLLSISDGSTLWAVPDGYGSPDRSPEGSSGGEPAGLSTLIWWQWPRLSSFVVPGGQLLEEITETKFWTKINHMQSGVLWDCSLVCLGKDPNTNWWVRHRRLCWGSFRSSRSALHPFLCPGRLTQSAWRASLQLWDPGTSSYVQPMQTPAGDPGLGWGWVFISSLSFLAESSWDDLLLNVMAGGWCWGGHSSLSAFQ